MRRDFRRFENGMLCLRERLDNVPLVRKYTPCLWLRRCAYVLDRPGGTQYSYKGMEQLGGQLTFGDLRYSGSIPIGVEFLDTELLMVDVSGARLGCGYVLVKGKPLVQRR